MQIELKTMLPFLDTEGRVTDKQYRVELVMETAKSKAGLTPFKVHSFAIGADKPFRTEHFSGIDDALEACNARTREMSNLRPDHPLWGEEGKSK